MNLSIDYVTIGTRLLESLPYIVGMMLIPQVYNLLFYFVQPVAERMFDSKRESEALRARNDASGVNRFGAYAGIVLALALSLLGGASDQSYWTDFGHFCGSAVITIVTFMFLHHILDRVVVRKIDNSGLVAQGNMAVAITESAAYIALGLIIGGSFCGNGQAFWPGIGSGLLFSVLGTIALMVVYTVYTLAWRRFRLDVDTKIGEGHLPSAIDAGSVLIAVAVTLFFSIAGDYTGWTNDLLSFGVAVAASTVLVPAGRFVAGKLLNASDKQSTDLGRSLLLGAITIGIGLMAAMAI